MLFLETFKAVPEYPDTRRKLPLPGSIFRFQLPVKDFWKFWQKEVSDLLVNGDATSRF